MPAAKPEIASIKKAWKLYNKGRGPTPYMIAKMMSTPQRQIHRRTVGRWLAYVISGKVKI